MPPHGLTGAQAITSDDFVVTALFLRVHKVAVDSEGGPAWTDRATPQLDRRRLGPIALDPHTVDDSVSLRATETGPLGRSYRRGVRRRWRVDRRCQCGLRRRRGLLLRLGNGWLRWNLCD